MIWLIGNRGMLGTEIQFLLEEKQIPYIASDKEVDITNPVSISNFADSRKITWVVNCSAYTAVDKAEDEKELAFKINEEGVKNLANFSQKNNAKLIHFSTDYVFDGTKKEPYIETDPTNPISIYGKSKLAGELAIRNVVSAHFILRTSWLYGRYGNNFVKTMVALFNQRASVAVVSDQIGSPTYTFDLAGVVIHLIQTKAEQYGVYHFSNEDRCSWFEFAKEIHTQAIHRNIVTNRTLEIRPITTPEYPTKATRPANSLLSKEKIKSTFSLSIRSWKEALQNYWE
jgi:dTDP-4-dehydrorhamnose reductase